MTPKEITVNVSKKLGQANFSSAMLSASITMTLDPDDSISGAYLEGWNICWEEIEKQEKVLKDKVDMEEAVKEDPISNWPQPASSAPAQQGHFCSTCGKPMVYKYGTSKNNKPYKGWFCSEKGHPVEWIK